MNLINNVQYKLLLHTYPYKLLAGWESCTLIAFTTLFYLSLAFLLRLRAVTFGVFLVSFVSFTVFFSPLPAAGFGTFFSPFLDMVCKYKKIKTHHTYNTIVTLTHQCSVNIGFIIRPLLDRQTLTSRFGFLVGISIGTSCGISSSSLSFSSTVSLVFRSDTSVFLLSLFLFCAPYTLKGKINGFSFYKKTKTKNFWPHICFAFVKQLHLCWTGFLPGLLHHRKMTQVRGVDGQRNWVLTLQMDDFYVFSCLRVKQEYRL